MHRHLDCSRIYDSILHPHHEISEYNTLEHFIYNEEKKLIHHKGLHMNSDWLLLLVLLV
jgi:hypothetical protein